MKITDKASLPLSQTQANSVKKATDKIELSNRNANKKLKGAENIQVSLSNRAQDMMKAKSIAQNTPDVRIDKVEGLKDLIKSGKYKIDSTSIADKMVDESLMDLI